MKSDQNERQRKESKDLYSTDYMAWYIEMKTSTYAFFFLYIFRLTVYILAAYAYIQPVL